MQSTARKQLPANRPCDLPLRQPFLFTLSGVAANHGGLRLLDGKGEVEHRFRRAEITLDVGRRKREQRTDAVEAVPARILDQSAGQSRIEMDPKQIANRLGVLA